MKVLHLIASVNPVHGGTSHVIHNSIPALEQLGVGNEVVSFDSSKAPFIQDTLLTIHALDHTGGPYAYCKRLEPWLFDNLHRFDAVIIHGLWLYNSYGTYRAWRKYKTHHAHAPKLYVMPHGMLDPYFQKAPDRKLKAIRNRIFWSLIERHVINGADGLLFTCEQELLLARETLPKYLPKKELNVGYGIAAPPPYHPTISGTLANRYPTLKDKSYWLFMSRIHPKKGVDLLVNAYLSLKTQYPNLPALVIAGPGLEMAYGKQVIRLASNEPDIMFTGMLTGDAKWGALYGCEVCCLPSHQENFGIAIVEALACGKPVLVTNQVNIWREIITGGGGLVAADTEEDFYSLLKAWHNLNKNDKDNIALAATKTFETKFTIEIAATNLANTLKAIEE